MNIRLIGIASLASLAMAGCATTSPGYGYGTPAPASSSVACYDCGTVTRIELVSGSSAPSATGAVLGGIVGAVAGHEISAKTGGDTKNQNISAAAGAVAGAVAGNAIQKRNASGTYNVYVRMNDGRNVVVTQSDIGGIREGSYVRVANGKVWPR